MINYLKIYFALIMAGIRSQMNYRISFLYETISIFILAATDLIGIWIIVYKFKSIGGWNLWEVCYLYGMATCSLTFAQLLTTGIDVIPQLVSKGEFDKFFIRPLPVFLQVIPLDFSLFRLGRFFQGVAIIIIALVMLKIHLTFLPILFILIGFISSTVIFFALFWIGGTQCIWTVENSEFLNAFTFGGHQVSSFPMNVYRESIRTIFFFIVPVGFASYFPALKVLSHPDALNYPTYMAWTTPLAALVILFVARVFWSFGLKHYESTGS